MDIFGEIWYIKNETIIWDTMRVVSWGTGWGKQNWDDSDILRGDAMRRESMLVKAWVRRRRYWLMKNLG